MFNNVHDRLYILRRMRDLNDSAIALELGVHPATVGGWIHGRTKPSYETMAKIAEAYNCSLDWLIGRAPLEAIEYEERIYGK